MNDNIAILHDRWTEMGGAEHVAVEMARLYDAPIYVGVKDESEVPEDVEVREAFDRRFEQAAMRRHYLIRDACQMLAWQHVDALHDYDTLIVNKNNPGWFIPKDDQTIVKYCHTTPRQPYDLFHEHGDHYLSRLVKTPMRVLYRPNITYPDAWACNSDLVQHRVQKYWGISTDETDVIYPPVDVESYGPEYGTGSGEYYVTLSRLVGHKRMGEIVAAFTDLGDDYQLKVAGDGPKRAELEAAAGANVDVLGYVSEEEKRRLLADAKGFVFNAENEDFGLVPVEAMASGTPVIGVEDGFTQHQILDGKNGYTYPRGKLREAIPYFDRQPVDWSPSRIAEFADRFGTRRFQRNLHQLVSDAQAKTSVEPEWAVDERAADADHGEVALADGGGER